MMLPAARSPACTVREADNTVVQGALDEDEVSEVGVDRHQHALVGDCPLQDDAITRIRRIGTNLHDIVTLLAEPIG